MTSRVVLINLTIFAATLVPRIDTVHPAAARKTAVREPAVQYLVKMASNRSHWFQSANPQALLIAAVDKIPRLADNVTAIGLLNSCDHIAPVFVLLHRAISGWFVIRVAVLPIPVLIDQMKNQPQPLVLLVLEVF